MKVHSALGPGLLESTYRVCLARELARMGVGVHTEVAFPVIYEGFELDLGYRVDILVEELVIVELKAVHQLAPVHRAQVLTYLKLSRLPLGLLLNFNTVRMKEGIVRLINSGSERASTF